MKLTGIFLYPDLGEFKSSAALSFRNQTRFVCHYVQQFLAARKIETDGFNRMCVVGRRVASGASVRNSSNVLVVEVPFDIAEYEQTLEDDLPEYFIGLLAAGFTKGSRDAQLPLELFQEAITSFRQAGYKNNWVHTRRMFRSAGISCELLCELDRSAFHLILEVQRGGEQIFSQEILRTLPDEVAYVHRFKDVVLEGHTLLVRDKFGKSLFALNLQERNSSPNSGV